MRDIRPFGWVIIAINAYILISFFAGYDVNGDDTANGIGIMVPGTKKRECHACGKNVKKGLTVCPSCNFDFAKAAGNALGE